MLAINIEGLICKGCHRSDSWQVIWKKMDNKYYSLRLRCEACGSEYEIASSDKYDTPVDELETQTGIVQAE